MTRADLGVVRLVGFCRAVVAVHRLLRRREKIWFGAGTIAS
jgi:hypothetical protein